MGTVFDFKDVQAYGQWMNDPRNKTAIEGESRLMMEMLTPLKTDSAVSIGGCAGTRLLPFVERGISLTAIDASPYMLDLLNEYCGNRIELYRGRLEDLPFEDNSFNHACLVTALEFVDHPEKVIEEACRVAKDKLFIGFLNRYAIKGVQRRVSGMFRKTLFNRANFFSVWELKKYVKAVAGDVPIAWRTVGQLPDTGGFFKDTIEQSRMLQRFPFGTFAGMVVTLVPRFRTRPLALRHNPKGHTETVPG
ncbi:MAG: class I SAM-dependent methyltransferase [Desulfobacterales bacterium]|nr:class I SAM-dependent methyltransferase [Desulfobacterales bacterium]